jgi:hypothetical protein
VAASFTMTMRYTIMRRLRAMARAITWIVVVMVAGRQGGYGG